ncbi:MAG: hypothetical protein QM644_02205 [Mobilitalea sp.]
MEQRFALYDSDLFYATRFMEYYKKKKEYNFVFLLFTKKESLEDYLTTHEIELLIADEDVSLENLPKEKIKHSYRLVHQLTNNLLTSEETSIFKYQSAGKVMEELFLDYYKKKNESRTILPTAKVRINSILSLTPNVEALAYAWSSGLLLSEHRKVLLVLLELLPVPLIEISQASENALSEFIYYLKENNNIMSKTKGLERYVGKLTCLSGFAHGMDLISLNRNDVQRWLEELKNKSDYDNVIFYLSGYCEAGFEIINQSDTVVFPEEVDFIRKGAQEAFINQMLLYGINNLNSIERPRLNADKDLEKLGLNISELTRTKTWSYAREKLADYL